MSGLLLPPRGLPETFEASGDVVDVATARLGASAVRLDPLGDGAVLATTATSSRVTNAAASALLERRVTGAALILPRRDGLLPASVFDRLTAVGAFALELDRIVPFAADSPSIRRQGGTP